MIGQTEEKGAVPRLISQLFESEIFIQIARKIFESHETSSPTPATLLTSFPWIRRLLPPRPKSFPVWTARASTTTLNHTSERFSPLRLKCLENSSISSGATHCVSKMKSTGQSFCETAAISTSAVSSRSSSLTKSAITWSGNDRKL